MKVSAATDSRTAPLQIRPSGGPALDDLRKISQEVVGRTLFGAMFEQMRKSRLKGSYGHGGRGEEVFAAQLHGVLAERMGASKSTGLSEAMVQRFQNQIESSQAD